MKEEIWKDIAEYEGLYQVSNLGHVRSLDRIIKYTNRRVVHAKSKIIKCQGLFNHFIVYVGRIFDVEIVDIL